LLKRYGTYPEVDYFNYNGHPFFIVSNPLIHRQEIIARDIAVFDLAPILAEMNLANYRLKITPRADLNLGQMQKIDDKLFTHDDMTWFVGNVDHSNAVLLLEKIILSFIIRSTTAPP